MKKYVRIAFIIVVSLLCLNVVSFRPVKYGVSIWKALYDVMNQKALIIYWDYDGLGSYYRNGLNREYITLIGRNPYHEISNRLETNKILVYGEFQKDISEFYNEPVFYVTEWKIIFPIKRQYSLSDDAPVRVFSPIFFLDTFDEVNDIHEYVNADMSISYKEADFLAYTKADDYFVVTPEVLEHEIIWHQVQYKLSNSFNARRMVNSEKIYLKGDDLPESILNSKVLFDECVNHFFINGHRQGNELYVKSWKIIAPFENYEQGAGKNFLDENDVIIP